MTARWVLRGEGGFSKVTRANVMQKGDDLGHLPHCLATVLADDKTSAFAGVLILVRGNAVFASV